jgi:hypothetical protein
MWHNTSLEVILKYTTIQSICQVLLFLGLFWFIGGFHTNLFTGTIFLFNGSSVFLNVAKHSHYRVLLIRRARRFLLPTFLRPLRGRFLCGCGIGYSLSSCLFFNGINMLSTQLGCHRHPLLDILLCQNHFVRVHYMSPC